ncbi:CPBP family intramembrane metalloprotease [Nocardia huaxiensis]|uniref:CPBP family intramembrane metalloprotease n=1 Tax=Nocardia huaxiensis TaxID=2755382 RepID=A0A7D6ZIE9_9NOCA|nr:CPBP family intramembrane glutamic endopeptidase [Nocardia huaxiensis]QLY28683.1 CPBP family intramembrane metalloprotease [Nocardia huaxiensis]
MALFALGAGVLLWLLPTFASIWLEDPSGSDFDIILVVRWAAAMLLLSFVLFVERRPLSSLGLRIPQRRDVAVVVPITAAALITGILLYSLVGGGGDTQTSSIIDSLSVIAAIHLIVNAAVVEELFFRGLLMERVIELTGRPWLAALASFVVFTGSHIPGSGWATALTMTAAGAALFAGIYWWRRNLVLCIEAHALSNLPILGVALG